MKKWRKLKQHFIKNHCTDNSMVSAMQEVAGLNTAGEQIFFSKMHTHYLKFSFDSTAIWHFSSTHQSGTWVKSNACHLGTQICWLLINICFYLFFTAHWRQWCREKTGTAVVHSCQNHTDKQGLISSAVGSIQTFEHVFFRWSQLIELLFRHLDNCLAQLSVGY